MYCIYLCTVYSIQLACTIFKEAGELNSASVTRYPSYELLISEFVKHVFKDSEITSPACVAYFVIIVNVITACVVVRSSLGACSLLLQNLWSLGGRVAQTHLVGSCQWPPPHPAPTQGHI